MFIPDFVSLGEGGYKMWENPEKSQKIAKNTGFFRRNVI